MHRNHSWGGGGCASPQISQMHQSQAVLGSKPGFLPWEMTAPGRNPEAATVWALSATWDAVQLLVSTGLSIPTKKKLFPCSPSALGAHFDKASQGCSGVSLEQRGLKCR